MNNKEITCRLVDGKPVIKEKEMYIPKKGDIVVCGAVKENGEYAMLGIVDIMKEGNIYFQFSVLLKSNVNSPILILRKKDYMGYLDYWRKATSEEAEVMHHFLNENGYEFVGDTAVKKR